MYPEFKQKREYVMSNISEKPFLTLEEVAEYLNVDYQLIYKLVKTGQLPAIKVGRVFRIRSSDLENYFLENSTSPESGRDRKKCSTCGREYNSKLMLKYKCSSKDCGEVICVDCWERKKIYLCGEHEKKDKNVK